MTGVRTVHIVGRGIVAHRLQSMLHGMPLMLHDSRWRDVSGVQPGDVVVLAHGGPQAQMAATLVGRRLDVVTVGEQPDDVDELLGIDAAAQGVTLVVGAAMSPGMSGLIARHLADQLELVDEVHVAVHGTAGPACARVHHRSLSGLAAGWHDGDWLDYVGGSGRELCWFPEPIGAKDCYRARSATPQLLHEVFPTVERISSRRSARRRDRFTAWLPMLSPPHQEGGIGALRVEVRGAAADGSRRCLIAGVAELVGSATAATTSAFVTAMLDGALDAGVAIAGDPGLPTVDLLRRAQSFGARLQEFTGVPQGG